MRRRSLEYVGLGQSRVGEREGRVLADRLVVVFDGLFEGFAGPLVPVEAAFEIKLICLVAFGISLCYTLGAFSR